MSPSPIDLLRHMLDELEYLQDERTRLTKESFLANETLRRAFSRSIEILGEAAKQMPADFRELHSQVPWKAIAGMRDRLIHGYFAVDYDIVWDVVDNKVADLAVQLREVLQQLPD
jgi:uncharacterized protein with HEPN domain